MIDKKIGVRVGENKRLERMRIEIEIQWLILAITGHQPTECQSSVAINQCIVSVFALLTLTGGF